MPARATSDVDRPPQHRECRFLGRLGQRRMRVYRDGDVFRRATILHGEYDFRNEFRDVWPDHVAAENLVGMRIRYELDETLRHARGRCAPIRREGKLARLVLAP